MWVVRKSVRVWDHGTGALNSPSLLLRDASIVTAVQVRGKPCECRSSIACAMRVLHTRTRRVTVLFHTSRNAEMQVYSTSGEMDVELQLREQCVVSAPVNRAVARRARGGKRGGVPWHRDYVNSRG